MASLM